MPDYSKSKIYKLVSNHTNEIYIGSTCQLLHQRKSGHFQAYKKYLSGKGSYITSFKLFEKGEVDIILIEECNFHNKDELHKKEREYIEKLECVNKYIPTRTGKEYYQTNKEKVKEFQKQYRETNKHIIQQYLKKNMKKLKEERKQYYEVNKDKVKEYNYNNKEKRKLYNKEYHQNNKEKIQQQKKQYREKKKLEKLNLASDSV